MILEAWGTSLATGFIHEPKVMDRALFKNQPLPVGQLQAKSPNAFCL